MAAVEEFLGTFQSCPSRTIFYHKEASIDCYANKGGAELARPPINPPLHTA